MCQLKFRRQTAFVSDIVYKQLSNETFILGIVFYRVTMYL